MQRKVKLRLASLYPNWVFYAKDLDSPLRTLQTPLLQALLVPDPGGCMGFGFLTLDQGRRLLCLLEDEALAQEVPLVGIWVDLRHESQEESRSPASSAAVWAAAAHFVQRRQVREKVWVDTSTFLVMSVTQQRTTPSGSSSTKLLFSEFRYEEAPDEGLHLASVDFEVGQAGPEDLGQSLDLTYLDTFTADLVDLAKIAGGAATSMEVLRSRAPELPERTPSPSHQSEAEPQGLAREELRTSVASLETLGNGRPEEPRSQPRPAAEDCRSCGASYVGEAAFCSHCGLRRPLPSPPDAPPQTHLWKGTSSPRKGRISSAPAAHPSTPSWRSEASESEGVSLRHIVGQQQQQLGLLQSQLQSVQQLLTHLVTKGYPQPTTLDVPKADVAVNAALDEVQVSVAHVQTSPRSTVSIGLQASVSMQEAAVNTVSAKPEQPKQKPPLESVQAAIRDSADTAGGASPRCLPEAQPPTIRGQLEPSWNPMVGVPRILCPSDLSMLGSDDEVDAELSDDGSIDLMVGDLTLEPVYFHHS
ncbi:STIL [Symbiodinium pilosum]|uniref:STIL protein n=1 Tax=Symbiodinium pilosum TaxID=2952 RepID=A0A812J8Z8_SYMPI|nr:STIL [Symbiodinium pilosum]